MSAAAMNGASHNANGNGHRPEKPRVLVAGGLGAVGSLVADLLAHHEGVELTAVTARDTGDENSPIGKYLYEIYPEHRVDVRLQTFESLTLTDFDAAIVAYPTGAASVLTRQLRNADITVIDSCGDFRFGNVETYEDWYGAHEAPELLDEAVYGLPEIAREDIAGAPLVGNPGCYPTASVLALAPLARAELIEDLVIDAKSGVSGAGKRGGAAPPFVGTDENMRPYGVPGHRHEPEIVDQLENLGYEGDLTFVPHLIPLDQGELVSCYVKPTRSISNAELQDLYTAAYDEEPFVELTSSLPTSRDVQRTNICRLHPMIDHDQSRIFVFATIDNLWKGGASQAVQNLNLALGLPEGEGISDSVAVPSGSTDSAALDRSSASV